MSSRGRDVPRASKSGMGDRQAGAGILPWVSAQSGQWEPPGAGEDCQLVEGKSISFYNKFTFSVTPSNTELGCEHKNSSCRGEALYLMRDREAQDHLQ